MHIPGYTEILYTYKVQARKSEIIKEYKANNYAWPASSRWPSIIREQQRTARKHQESTNNTNQQTSGSKPPPAKTKSTERECFFKYTKINNKCTLSTAQTPIIPQIHNSVSACYTSFISPHLSCCFLNADCRPE